MWRARLLQYWMYPHSMPQHVRTKIGIATVATGVCSPFAIWIFVRKHPPYPASLAIIPEPWSFRFLEWVGAPDPVLDYLIPGRADGRLSSQQTPTTQP